jgi:hypothetical protein
MKETVNGTGYPTHYSMKELNLTVNFMNSIIQETYGFYKSPNHSRFSLCPSYGFMFLVPNYRKNFEIMKMERKR